jgi:uncharacterized protein YdhG (YjbR/CyaY superfamily)
MRTFKDVDSYLAEAPDEIRDRLIKLRRTIQKAAPKAMERISYGIPFYEYGGTGYKGRLVYFAAFKNHISVFLPSSGALSKELAREINKYHAGKATYKFPLNEPFPFPLIGKVVKEMVKQRNNVNRTPKH